MRKLFLSILIVLSAVFLTACGDNTAVNKVTPPPSNTVAPSPSNTVGQSNENDNNADSSPADDVKNVATLGGTLERGGIEFTFDKVENYVDTGDMVMDKPEEGKNFVLLWFTIRNTTDEDYFVNTLYGDSYCDGLSISAKSIFFSVPGESAWGNVAAGKARQGYVGYELPIGWNEIEFQYKPVFAGQESKLIFKATKDDLI